MSKRVKGKSVKAASQSSCACIEFQQPSAKEVCIAGSLNDWNPNVTPMIPVGDGKWTKELVLRPGRYEYRFVVDGQWIDDRAAKETVPNPFGGLNAVLVVTASPTATNGLAKAEAQSARRFA